jgi:hypothetical protein
MPNPSRHEALHRFAVELGAQLRSALEAGAELPFEVLEEAGGGPLPRRAPTPVLYRYRALTDSFIGARWADARRLESYRAALEAVTAGAGAYLRHRGLLGSDPDDALRDIAERLFDDVAGFELPEDRFERLCGEIEVKLRSEVVHAAVIAPLHGVRIASARVQLRPDLALVRRGALHSPPTALEGAARTPERTAQAEEEAESVETSPLDVFCLHERELHADAALPVDEARSLFRRLLTALRLSGAGGTAIGGLAWGRADDGAWHPVALGLSARSRPESWELRPADESELRELLELLALSRHGETLAWALERFEMGCERELETEALSDYLLALRALLAEPEPAAGATVARRLAVLCAAEPERDEARARLELALEFERGLIHGSARDEATLGLESPRVLVREVERHLRALLRDVLCGYLDQDLRRTADDMLAAVGAAGSGLGEITVHDARVAPDEEPDGEAQEPLEAAVTPSIDWEPGDE